ncbi:hypothetical protein HEP_00504900, partial [Hepatocystis sp. ex Piliocolobus tephrosceles]
MYYVLNKEILNKKKKKLNKDNKLQDKSITDAITIGAHDNRIGNALISSNSISGNNGIKSNDIGSHGIRSNINNNSNSNGNNMTDYINKSNNKESVAVLQTNKNFVQNGNIQPLNSVKTIDQSKRISNKNDISYDESRKTKKQAQCEHICNNGETYTNCSKCDSKSNDDPFLNNVTEKNEIAKNEIAKNEMAKSEMAKNEMAKSEMAKNEIAKNEMAEAKEENDVLKWNEKIEAYEVNGIYSVLLNKIKKCTFNNAHTVGTAVTNIISPFSNNNQNTSLFKELKKQYIQKIRYENKCEQIDIKHALVEKEIFEGYKQLHIFLYNLKELNAFICIDWFYSCSEPIKKKYSKLIYLLHCVNYLKYLKYDNLKALNYLRELTKNFSENKQHIA